MAKKKATTKAKKKTSKKKVTKNKGGRPQKIKFDDNEPLLNCIRALAKEGKTHDQMAEIIGINVATLYRYKLLHEEFREVLNEGKSIADEMVEQSLFNRAVGYSGKDTKMFQHEGCIVSEEYIKHYPPDPTSCIFWLKNRKPDKWKDKREMEFGEDTKITLNYSLDD